MTIGVAALVTTATLGLTASSPLRVTVSAPGHTPKIKVHWNYTLEVTRDGKPVAAKLSEAIVDPIGGVHPVQFGRTRRTSSTGRSTARSRTSSSGRRAPAAFRSSGGSR